MISFFKAQATPEEIEEAASHIAAAVKQSLPAVTMGSESPQVRSVELPKLSDSKDALLVTRSSSQVQPDSPSVAELLSSEKEQAPALEI